MPVSNVAVIDDQRSKFEQIGSLITEIIPHVRLNHIKTFQSAIRQLKPDEIDLLVLDMSFNVNDNPSEISGFENLAGLRVLQHMYRRRIKIPVIIFTAHTEFADAGTDPIYGIAELRRYVDEYFPGYCVGCLYSKDRPEVLRKDLRDSIKVLIDNG